MVWANFFVTIYYYSTPRVLRTSGVVLQMLCHSFFSFPFYFFFFKKKNSSIILRVVDTTHFRILLVLWKKLRNRQKI